MTFSQALANYYTVASRFVGLRKGPVDAVDVQEAGAAIRAAAVREAVEGMTLTYAIRLAVVRLEEELTAERNGASGVAVETAWRGFIAAVRAALAGKGEG